MRKIPPVFGLTALLLTAPLLRADALTVQLDVGPASIQTLPYTFEFTSEDRDGLKQVGVTIALKKDSRRPEPQWSHQHRLSARLHLLDDKMEIAAMPLEEAEEGGKVTYWFHIAPGLLAKSRFEFDVFSGKEEKLPDGKTRFIGEPGTLQYWFNLRDFITLETANKSNSKTGGRTYITIGNFFSLPGSPR